MFVRFDRRENYFPTRIISVFSRSILDYSRRLMKIIYHKDRITREVISNDHNQCWFLFHEHNEKRVYENYMSRQAKKRYVCAGPDLRMCMRYTSTGPPNS